MDAFPKLTPEQFPQELQDTGELVRQLTARSQGYEHPSPNDLHSLYRHARNQERFNTITRLLDRRLDPTDLNYNSIQMAKTLSVIHNALLSGPPSFVVHYNLRIPEIANLQYVNLRDAKDSPEGLKVANCEAKKIVDLLKNGKELASQRALFSSYRGPPPPSMSGIDRLFRQYTSGEDLIDPRGMLEKFYLRVTDEADREILIILIERRLNPSDTNYTCDQLFKALKVLKHCLPASDEFIQYWIDNSTCLVNLRNGKCRHNSCSNDKMPEIRASAVDILARLDHHARRQSRGTPSTRPSASMQVDDRTMSSTPPPAPQRDWNFTPDDLDLHSIGVKNLTTKIIRSQPYPEGNGAFSDVYKEKLEGTGDTVAVKVLRRVEVRDGSRFIKIFKRELKIWAGLDHPYINSLLGVAFSHNRSPAFVSTWQENGTLLQYLELHPNTNRVVMFHKIVEGVQYLHDNRKRVIHGDIKPSNVLVKDNGDPAVSDYGLAKLHDDIDSSTSGEGTLNYRAPELLDGKSRSQASDVWALGGVLYAMYTGRDPYYARNKPSVMSEIRKGPPSRPEPADEKFPMNDELWKLILHCFEEDPSERPSTDQLLRQLHKIPNRGLLYG